MNQIKQLLQKRIVEQIDFGQDFSEEALLDLIQTEIQKESQLQFISVRDRLRLKQEIYASVRGLDILQFLLDSSEITEIMVNGKDNIFVEVEGRLKRWKNSFDTEERLQDIAQQIASGSNRIVNASQPIVDARLSDGSRVSIVLPPVALDGPVITIRKFPLEVMTMEKLIGIRSITKEAADFLILLVQAGYNIFISGGTGSGKTTFLNALSSYIPKGERVITIEDSAELQLKNVENLVRLEVRNANQEGNNEITIRDLIKASLRMRPDRIVIGEVRDAACIDMLQALNTGHSGLSTGHANSSRDILSRLETMCILGAEIPLLAVRKQIVTALDIIVQLGRLRDKSRRVLEICEVGECLNGDIVMNPLFQFVEEGENTEGKVFGELKPTKNWMQRINKGKAAGIYQKLADAGMCAYET